MLSLLNEVLVRRLRRIPAMIFVLSRRKVANAEHCHHIFLGGLRLVLLLLLLVGSRSLAYHLLLFLLLLLALDLLVGARAPLPLLQLDHLLSRQGLGHVERLLAVPVVVITAVVVVVGGGARGLG